MTSDILFEERTTRAGALGLITLNRPAALNSLNHAMIKALSIQLKTWATASHIKAVIIQAVPGRAFCAGGDIREAYYKMVARQPDMADFFRDEYALNEQIFSYPKPYIALLDGITMGGGAGISVHGSHRLVTENVVFAMPETGIGFYPDVGGTWFLPRLPGRMGYYLGLTGARIGADDCVNLGIATMKVAEAQLPAILNALAELNHNGEGKQAVSEALAPFAQPLMVTPLQKARLALEACFNQTTVEQILIALQRSTNDLCQQAAHDLLSKSPTSLKVTFRALEVGKSLNFGQCMAREEIMTRHFMQGHDFTEGIRALLIDKTSRPQWQPATLQAVEENALESYCSPLRKISK